MLRVIVLILAVLPISALAHDITARQAAIGGVWVGAQMGVARPDISNMRPAGRAVMENYRQAEDGVLNCLIDWGRLTTVTSFPFEIIVGESQVTILHEYNHTVRRVFLNREDFPVDYPPSLVGYSIGHWDGDTLVTETRKLLNGWINMEGVAPYTDAAVVTEQFWYDSEAQQLVAERTIVDPELYDGPVTWVTRYVEATYPIYPYDCTIGAYLTSDQ
jgi:hypothetical protein